MQYDVKTVHELRWREVGAAAPRRRRDARLFSLLHQYV